MTIPEASSAVDHRSWWHTLPGLLTAFAAVLTAVGGLVAALSGAGLLSKKSEAPEQVEEPAGGSSSDSDEAGPVEAVASPIVISAAHSIEETEQAILDVLPTRGWVAVSVKPGTIGAFLSGRDKLLSVELRYDESEVAIYYSESDNLGARLTDNGVVKADPKVNAWMRNLATDLSTRLRRQVQR